VTVETCPHYLVLEAEGIPDGDPRFKCAPPIRTHENRERLWAGLVDGTIDFVATDHSPCPPGLKHLDTGDLPRAWGGIASIQFLLPLVWTEARRRGCSLADLERWVCTRPATFAGLGQVKGRLAPGYRADLVAWDPEADFFITPETLVYRHKVTPYGGRAWQGVVHTTWLGGTPVWSQGPWGQPQGRSLLRPTEVDALPDPEARAVLKKACGSDAWVEAVAARRPFGDYRRLAQVATEAWAALPTRDKRQAYAAHPRIGEKFRANREQAGVQGASTATLDALARANEAYEAKFGFGFLVFATGKTADQMLGLIEARLGRSVAEEEAEASVQHHKITLFRLAQGVGHGR